MRRRSRRRRNRRRQKRKNKKRNCKKTVLYRLSIFICPQKIPIKFNEKLILWLKAEMYVLIEPRI